MPDTNGFSTQEEIDAAFEQLRNAHDAQSAGPAFSQLTKALGKAGLLPLAMPSKGRVVDPLPTYTFKNGAVATIHRIGQMTVAQIAAGVEKKTPAVVPPTFMADMGAGPVEQSNPASKEYQAAVAQRRGLVNMATMDKLIDLAIDIDVDAPALERLRTGMERIDEPLNELSDKVAFIKHCCVTDANELTALSGLITGNVEEAAEAAQATFSGDVSGPTAEALEPTAVGGALQPDLRADYGGPLARHLRRGDGESAD